jgi:hypothetical protein
VAEVAYLLRSKDGVVAADAGIYCLQYPVEAGVEAVVPAMGAAGALWPLFKREAPAEEAETADAAVSSQPSRLEGEAVISHLRSWDFVSSEIARMAMSMVCLAQLSSTSKLSLVVIR